MTDDEIVAKYAGRAQSIAWRISRITGFRIPVDDLKQEALMASIPAFRSWNGLGSEEARVHSRMRFAALDALRQETGNRRVGFAYGAMVSIDAGYRRKNGDLELRVNKGPAVDPWPAMEAALDVETLMGGLKDRDCELVRRRMRGETLKAVGLSFGVSECRASQIEARALRVMRAAA